MIDQYFNMIFSFFSQIINIDFGFGIEFGAIILAFFILLAFIRFFMKPILGGRLTSGSSRPSRREGK